MLKLAFKLVYLVLNALELCIVTMVLYLMSYLPKALIRSYYAVLFRFWCQIFVNALGVDLKLQQKNRQRLPQQYVLISNHPSAFEDIGIPALFRVTCLAKQEVADWWFAGRLNKAAGTIFVQRESKASRQRALQDMIVAVKAGKNIALYPEGGCKGRRLAPRFFLGAFEVSITTGVPILPVFLHYECQEDFEWQPPYTLLHKIWHMLTSQNPTANYYVHDVIEPSQFTSKQEMADYTYRKYVEWNAKYLE